VRDQQYVPTCAYCCTSAGQAGTPAYAIDCALPAVPRQGPFRLASLRRTADHQGKGEFLTSAQLLQNPTSDIPIRQYCWLTFGSYRRCATRTTGTLWSDYHTRHHAWSDYPGAICIDCRVLQSLSIWDLPAGGDTEGTG